MTATRIIRIIFGLLLVGVFAWYMKAHNDNWLKTDDAHYIIENFVSEDDEDYTPMVIPADSSETPVETEVEPSAEPEATPEPTLDPDSPAARALALGLPVPPDIDINEWQFMLVNADNPLDPIDYAPADFAYLNMTADESDIQYGYNPNRCEVDARIADALMEFALGCREAGLPVYLSSGFRSYSAQVANFQRVCNNNGITDGKDANGHYITMPAGCSEHQTGLACDITDHYREIKNETIENTDTYKWLNEHCAEYGFIHRFPRGSEDITGVMYEPFHFRYVGVEVARYMTDNNLCLEEFVALYR